MSDTETAPLSVEDVTAPRDVDGGHWRIAVESAELGVWDLDLVSGACSYSPSWKRMLGYEPHELDDRDELWLMFIHPDDRERSVDSGDRHMAGETSQIETEFRLRHRLGHWIWVLDRGRIVERDAAGRPTRMIGVQTEITRQKHAESELVMMNERIGLTLDAGQIGLWHYDMTSGTIEWDPRMREIFGIGPDPDAVSLSTWFERVHPDDLVKAKIAVDELTTSGRPLKLRHRIVKLCGEMRYVQELARMVVRDDGGRMFVGCVWDVTELVMTAQALAAEKERLRITLRSIGDAVLSTDLDDRIIFANPAAEDLLQRRQDALNGARIDEVFALVDEATHTALATATRLSVETGGTVDRQENALLIRGDGSRRSVRDLASPVIDPSGAVIGSVLVVQDVTKARLLQRDLAHAARHDALTGLLNRTALTGRLAAILKDEIPSGSRHALFYLDVDRFKMINDTIGHAAGDRLLKGVAAAMRSVLPVTAEIGRLGGDEFAAVVPLADGEDGMAIAANLVREIDEQRLPWAGKLHQVGVSIGIAGLDEPGAEPEAVLARADSACYVAKAEGRGRAALYTPSVGAAQRNLAEIQAASGLSNALAERRILLYGQEIRDLSRPWQPGGHVEILCRLRAPDGSIVPPGQFIPAAERFGLIGAVDRFIIREALETYGQRLTASAGRSIGINLSANTLSEPSLWSFVASLLTKTGVDPACLVFEITETAAVGNFTAAQRFVADARGAGCRISLDDFGSGLSSFAYLQRFDVDSIKIDGAFIEKVATSRFDQSVVAAIAVIARELGVDIVAERIEDAQSVDVLRSLGVRYGQGYLFHRPEPLDDLFAGQADGTGANAL